MKWFWIMSLGQVIWLVSSFLRNWHVLVWKQGSTKGTKMQKWTVQWVAPAYLQRHTLLWTVSVLAASCSPSVVGCYWLKDVEAQAWPYSSCNSLRNSPVCLGQTRAAMKSYCHFYIPSLNDFGFSSELLIIWIVHILIDHIFCENERL